MAAQDRDWIATPELGPDYRGPVTRAFAPMPGPEALGPVIPQLAAIDPLAVAIAEASGTTDFAELTAAAARIAAALPPGTGPVGILLPTGVTYVAAVFGCLAAHRLAVLLDASYPDARNAQIAAAAGLDAVIAEVPVDWSGVATVVPPGPGAPELPLDGPPLGLDAPAFILTTSGSSGAPKLIVHSQATMLHWARTTHNALHVTADDRACSLSSLSSLGGFTALLSYPLAGASLQLLDLGTAGLGGLLDVLRGGEVSILRAAPSLLRGLAKLPDAADALRHLRIVQSYGEPLLVADVAALAAVLPGDCLIRTTYGSTEASGLSWFARAHDADDPLRVPAGVLMPDTEARIVADDGSDCARGEAGELVIRSRYNGLGEWQDGGLVPGRLLSDPELPGSRVYVTGDVARCDARGVFTVLGRRDRMLNLNGVRIEPAEIEQALGRLPGVLRAEVVVVRRGTAEQLVGVVAGPDEAALPGLKAQLRDTLPAAMVPSRLVAVPTMPLLPGGKVDAQALLALVQQ